MRSVVTFAGGTLEQPAIATTARQPSTLRRDPGDRDMARITCGMTNRLPDRTIFERHWGAEAALGGKLARMV
jgi:hypothetical protein